MERVTGVGGVFFRAEDPEGLAAWYATHLGVDPVPAEYGQRSWWQEAGPTVFAPMPAGSPHVGSPGHGWAVNFRVVDLPAMVAQLRRAGVEVEVDPTTYPNGTFADLHDPEDNPVQLWQPAGVDVD